MNGSSAAKRGSYQVIRTDERSIAAVSIAESKPDELAAVFLPAGLAFALWD